MGSFGGGEAITWEQLADMRDNGVDIQAHSATHQDLREGHTIMSPIPAKRTRTRLTGPQYEEWMQNEVVGSKQLLEQRLGIKVNCFAVPLWESTTSTSKKLPEMPATRRCLRFMANR